MIPAVLAVVAGVVLLAWAADQFVLGAARVALLRDLPPIAVGVLIIGFGTSAPELLVSGLAAADGEAEVAIGNVVGSNIANLSMLLGIGAVIVPILVVSRTVKREAPITVLAMVAFAVALQGGGISAVEGVVLLGALALALWMVTRGGDADPLGPEAEQLADAEHHSLRTEMVRTAIGLAGTIGGAQVLLWGALEVADRAGLGAGFVGATLVAIGTSLPELVTVIQSARRRETDLIVGNLLGSNMFNALGVGGLVGVIGATGIDDASLTVLAPALATAVAIIALVAMITGRTVGRIEGVGLIVLYVALVPLLA